MVSFICVCSLAIGGVQLWMSVRYWVDEKEESMSRYAESVAKLSEDFITTADNVNFVIADGTLSLILRLTPIDLGNAEVLVTDNRYQVVLSSKPGSDNLIGRTLPTDGVWSADTSFAVTSMNNLLGSNHYVASVPLEFHGHQIGYVLVTTPADSLSSYIVENLKIYGLAMLFVLIVAVLAIYLFTYRWVRPLREMAAATRRFGEGDFSCQISVRGKDELAELADSLNHMALSLSSLEGMRRSFVANISHELKTPMTTIAGFIDGILDGTIPADQQKKYLVLVSGEIKRLSRLVRTMLDLSRIDTGELHIRPMTFDLADAACQILLSFEQRIDQKNISITGLEDCAPTPVVADPDLIGQVMYNLIDNAVKFTNEGGTIDMHIGRSDGRVCYTIRNTGAGIPAEEMPHVFERFYKSDKSRSLDRTGVGLGLYIVKNVINIHKGEIIVRSVEGEYCEFSFWLPDVQADTTLSAPHDSDAKSRKA